MCFYSDFHKLTKFFSIHHFFSSEKQLWKIFFTFFHFSEKHFFLFIFFKIFLKKKTLKNKKEKNFTKNFLFWIFKIYFFPFAFLKNFFSFLNNTNFFLIKKISVSQKKHKNDVFWWSYLFSISKFFFFNLNNTKLLLKIKNYLKI